MPQQPTYVEITSLLPVEGRARVFVDLARIEHQIFDANRNIKGKSVKGPIVVQSTILSSDWIVEFQGNEVMVLARGPQIAAARGAVELSRRLRTYVGSQHVTVRER